MSRLRYGNIYFKLPRAQDKEIVQVILKNKKLLIEQIISGGQATEKGAWLKSTQDEWVLVLQGVGKLRFQSSSRLVTLRTGDYVYIPAHVAHRVEWTSKRKKTLWLAVHC
ncbi:MAG: cupin domain-containing protein [Candidatus Omnitrophica bacterium]|nr:cupin domain-containing protein [Candidatus Omnitrophota bacterium]